MLVQMEWRMLMINNDTPLNIFKFENLGLKIDQLASLSIAIEDAMQYSPNAEENYYGALTLLSNELYDCNKELQQLIDRGAEEMRLSKDE